MQLRKYTTTKDTVWQRLAVVISRPRTYVGRANTQLSEFDAAAGARITPVRDCDFTARGEVCVRARVCHREPTQSLWGCSSGMSCSIVSVDVNFAQPAVAAATTRAPFSMVVTSPRSILGVVPFFR